MPRKTLSIIILVLLVLCTAVYADTIHLKNGSKISGIITKETEDAIEIKINIGAIVTFAKGDIENIERDSDDARAEMEGAWESEKARRDREDITEVALETGDREDGLVEYEGKWVTPEEKERAQVASIVSEAGASSSEQRFLYKKGQGKRSSLANKLLEKGNWFLKETEHFSVFYRDLAQSKMVTDKAEYYFEKIAYDLGYEGEIKWDKKCQVYIVESINKWKSFLKDIGFNPDLVGGFVPNYEENEMYLCALSNMYLAATFPHELTHLIFGEIAGNSTIPLWLNEGLANYEASVISISNDLLVKQIRQGNHILLGDLLRMTAYPEGKATRELFYAQSEKLVEFLITQYGREKFRKFCELILKDKSFKDSLFTSYRGDFLDIEDFNIKLVEYIVK